MNNITPGVTLGAYTHMVTPSKGPAQQSEKLVSATNAKIKQSKVSQKGHAKDQIAAQLSFWAQYGVKCDSQGRPIPVKVPPQLTPQFSSQPSLKLSPEPAEKTIVNEHPNRMIMSLMLNQRTLKYHP